MDKFYTRPSVAVECVAAIEQTCGSFDQWSLVVEPSAGGGSFSDALARRLVAACGGEVPLFLAMDVEPAAPGIERRDFFDFCPPPGVGRTLVAGNPPFGRVSSMAVRFFNHAAGWADVVAFVVPRTFRRVSVQNRLDPSFHLAHDLDIPLEPCAFDPPMMAKCCFQIWERRSTPRRIVRQRKTHPDWEFLSWGPRDASGQPTPPLAAGPDFALRAVGGRCGEVATAPGLERLRPKSWHWIRVRDRSRVREVMERLAGLDYSVGADTARQNSVGRAELVELYYAAGF